MDFDFLGGGGEIPLPVCGYINHMLPLETYMRVNNVWPWKKIQNGKGRHLSKFLATKYLLSLWSSLVQ